MTDRPYTSIEGVVYTTPTSGIPIATQAFATSQASTAAAAQTAGLYEYVATTADVDGSTATLISTADKVVVPVTSANAAHFVVLPLIAVLGQEVHLAVGANGYELAPNAANGINGGTPGAGASSSIGADVSTWCRATSATQWTCSNYAADGTEAKTDASAT